MSNQSVVPFGKQFREKYFNLLDPKVVPVNHGSYGLVPKPIFDKFVEAIKADYSFPDRYIVFNQSKEYLDAIKALGEFLNCDYHNLAIVENATTGVNTVLRSYPFEKGDKVVIQNTVYGSCGNTVKFLEKRVGIVPIIVDLKYPLNDEDLLRKFEDIFISESPKLCMFDAVTSRPGVKLPFVELTQLCKKYNVLSLIDGAHSIGLIPLNLDFKPDFFTSNLHKWLFVPRGCAFLYVDDKFFNVIQTLPISHSYLDDDVKLSEDEQKNLLIDKFTFVGSKNFAPISTIKPAIEFRKNECGGEESIYKYCYELALKVGKLISGKWGTAYFNNENNTLVTAMVNIEIPLQKLSLENNFNLDRFDLNNPSALEQFQKYVNSKLVYKYNVYVQISSHNNKLFVRFSCQIYNEVEDYEYASDALIKCIVDYFNDDIYQKLDKVHL